MRVSFVIVTNADLDSINGIITNNNQWLMHCTSVTDSCVAVCTKLLNVNFKNTNYKAYATYETGIEGLNMESNKKNNLKLFIGWSFHILDKGTEK